MTITWPSIPLGDLVSDENPICYGILMPGEHVVDGIPVIKVKNFEGGYLNTSRLQRTSSAIDDQYRRSRALPGDVLLSIRGTTGEVAVVPTELPISNITQDTARVRVNGLVDRDFLVQALRSEVVQAQIRHHTIGQAVKGINIARVRKLEIPFPDIQIQKAISDVYQLGTVASGNSPT
jgi:type I restriction enzyme S subunit